jgi:hypothetical protein
VNGKRQQYDKARVYLYPALLLLKFELEDYKSKCEEWKPRLDKTLKDAEKILERNDYHKDREKCSKTCFWDSRHATEQPPSSNEWLGPEYTKLESEVTEAINLLLADRAIEYDPVGIGGKIWHGIKNPWDRKTTGEKIGFGTGMVLRPARLAQALGLERACTMPLRR